MLPQITRDYVVVYPDQRFMTGFKVFNQDWTCRNFPYKGVGVTSLHTGQVIKGSMGLHFCKIWNECFFYVEPFNKKFAQVKTPVDAFRYYGNLSTDLLIVTDRMTIVEEYTDLQVYSECLGITVESIKTDDHFVNLSIKDLGTINLTRLAFRELLAFTKLVNLADVYDLGIDVFYTKDCYGSKGSISYKGIEGWRLN